MTPLQFIVWSEGYYGDYRPVVKQELLRWLEEMDDTSDVFITGLKERVKLEYSNQYRIPPDIAILEKFREQETYDAGRKVLQLGVDRKRLENTA